MRVVHKVHSLPYASPQMTTAVTLRAMVIGVVPKTKLTLRRTLTTTCSAKKREKDRVIVISGPTGAGKSRLALELAKKLNGEIISADSVQVYQGLDIGSAKPSLSDRKIIRSANFLRMQGGLQEILFKRAGYQSLPAVPDCTYDGGDDGLLSEASRLLDVGLLPNSNPATRAIGYRQAMEYLLSCRRQGGRSSPGEFFGFLAEFQKASRNFAKRQLTWFRKELIYEWLDASQPLEKVLNFVEEAYRDKTGNLTVPESLQMRKDLANRKEIKDMKMYRPQNRHLVNRADCSEIFDWIENTQTEPIQVRGRETSVTV